MRQVTGERMLAAGVWILVVVMLSCSLLAWTLPKDDSAADTIPKLTPMPVTTATAYDFEKQIIQAITEGTEADYGVTVESSILSGSFTEPGADERLALVYLGPMDQRLWAIIGRSNEKWQLRGMGIAAAKPPLFPGWGEPQALDFDNDGLQEMTVPLRRMASGWLAESTYLYRWDGHRLALIWAAKTLEDNTQAPRENVSLPFRQSEQATWTWVDLDGDRVNDIRLDYTLNFYPQNEAGRGADMNTVLGVEQGSELFRWDGTAFRPFAPDGPAETFAYLEGSRIWLWQDKKAAPLTTTPRDNWEFAWSPDGRWLAWRAKDSASIEFLDRINDTQAKRIAKAGKPESITWTPGNRLVYAVAKEPAFYLIDPQTGQESPLPIPQLGSWSPGGNRIVYERDGNIYHYGLTTGEETLLLDGGTASAPIWSPRGDWIACLVATENGAGVAVFTSESAQPPSDETTSVLRQSQDVIVSSPTKGRNLPNMIRLTWSPDGSHLSALAGGYSPEVLTSSAVRKEQAAALYIAETPETGESVAGLNWQIVWETEKSAPSMRHAWSPDGSQITLIVGQALWDIPLEREPVLRYWFSFPEPAWQSLAWAPDGSGFLLELAGQVYAGRLYWFAADASKPQTLVSGPFLSDVQWAPGAGR